MGARTVDTVEDWIKAIKEIIENTKSTTIENEVNMVTCYQKNEERDGIMIFTLILLIFSMDTSH